MKFSVGIIEPVGGHGGMDYYDYGLALGLSENNVNVVLYTSNETKIRNYQNVTTKLFFNNMWKSNFIIKVLKYLFGHYFAIKDLKKRDIKILHLHFFKLRLIDLFIIKLAKFHGLIVIGTLHDINAFDKKANKLVEKKCINFLDGIIVHNQSSLNSLNKKQKLKSSIKIIPHGNYLPFLDKTKFKSLKNDDKLKLLFFGQIKKVKGLKTLLEAMKILKDADQKIELVIAGKAWKSDLNVYTELISKLNISEIVKTNFSYIPDSEVSNYFNSADLIVLPYTKIYQSGVLLLSMSYGKPVICSDLDPFKEIIIDNENGFLFQSENEIDLAKKIIDIIEKNKLSSVTENANALISSKFDWINIGKTTKEFYTNLLNNN